MSAAPARVVVTNGITSGMDIDDTVPLQCTHILTILYRCMGYHSVQDPRLPEQFICFNCRLRADPSWELIKVELYSSLIIKFRELASFRCV